ncbi:vegetative incompatibility protein HET-E-1 [Ophiobolus disseminans]|uniref:Vegetative incompatibility protein HET-E-1 n=1 Tax=Ophiobolus disseminans TaxID=1469910 RepID=A0A6A7AEG3_9PLEO|nr:vegetative incompatibility protein HET-E-1 [Ophiobolus disseminans]
MRLLRHDNDRELIITSFHENKLPPYAILSHTWGADTEEVIFADLVGGNSKANHGDGKKTSYKEKPGYKKILFCGEQARQDDLQYFWVDTCCIDKSDKAELSFAIQSMFRWYQNAAKCYAYLSDVSAEQKASSTSSEYVWEPGFQASRWFTRGWTLQELLAPGTVEFFSEDWDRLGDRRSLKSLIHKITSIPYEVLEGAPLLQFNVDERLRWRHNRHTKIKEDAAYSMSGIFNVDMAPVYGEGAEQAFGRLYDKIRKQEECLRDLCATDPCNDKKRIEDTKGGLLADSYRWVLDNSAFQQWQHVPHSQLLWVKGDPGKGKTMLLCGIIDELNRSMPRTALLSYFFCQATDSRINSATAVLRGLLYMLIIQQPSLVSYVRNKYNRVGKTLFEDANAWVALTEIFVDVLQDPSLSTTYLIIDALDECVTNRAKLLEFVAKQSLMSSRIKWILSSRNWPDIEVQLERADYNGRLSLELNAKSVAAAVNIFIHQKVDQLALEKQYKEEIRRAVLQHLTSNANDTFLWVALVCQDLKKTPNWLVLKKLALFPPGLDALYRRMIQQISESDSSEICQPVLASTALFYRPATIQELIAHVGQLDEFADDLGSVREIISLCGSFLTLREDTVYFAMQDQDQFTQLVQDARRFVMYHKGAIENYPLQTYASALMFSPTGSLIRQLFQHEAPKGITLKPGMSDSWSACLQTLEGHSNGVRSVAFSHDSTWLASASDNKTVKIWDASSGACLQTLEGHSDEVRSVAFSHDSTWLASASDDKTVKTWDTSSGACLQTLNGHSGWVYSVAFSQDSTWLASASDDRTVKIWDASSGACLRTLEGHSDEVRSVAFSHESTWLASASYDKTVKIWNASSGACLQTLEGHSKWVWSVAFSHDSTWLASASYDRTVKIWDASSGACLQTLKGHSDEVRSVAFSHDSTWLASASDDRTVKIWDASSGACLQTLEGHSDEIRSVAFSHNSTWLASASYDKTVKIWDASSGACLQKLEGHSDEVRSMAFSHDSTWLASASYDKTVKIWDASSGACLQTLEGHSNWVRSVAILHDSTRLASASDDRTVKIWDASSGACLQTLEGHSNWVLSVAFSHDSTRLVSASYKRTVKIWDASSGACLQTLNDQSGHVNSADLVSFLASSHLNQTETRSEHHVSQGPAISSDKTYISNNAQNLLWLPTEYRPGCSAVSSRCVGIGTGSGKVWLCCFL